MFRMQASEPGGQQVVPPGDHGQTRASVEIDIESGEVVGEEQKHGRGRIIPERPREWKPLVRACGMAAVTSTASVGTKARMALVPRYREERSQER